MRSWLNRTMALGLLAAIALSAGAIEPAGAVGARVAVIGKGIGGEYWSAVRKGATRAGRDLGLKVTYQGPPTETDVAAQIALLENLIQSGVDAIAISPCNARSLNRTVRKAMAAGIKVVTLDSDTTDKDRLSYIGTDNAEAGAMAAREALRLVPEGSVVAMVTGVLGAQNLQERRTGFTRAAKGKLRLLAAQPDNGDKARAVEVAENILTAHPEVTLFFTDNAISGPGVGQALKTRGKAGKVKLVSMDVTPDLQGLLDQGVASVLVAQQPEKMGELAVRALKDALAGKRIPGRIDTGVRVVRRKDS
ncbi:MAG: substrate-binding domain-containing protein [Candidatus Sericytochromatia bacterium]|nr:substrate-binding domain-containing protein [Candidatus Sericytochromatia bacterium]